MKTHVQGDLAGIDAFQPATNLAGEWGTVGGFSLREALSRHSLDGVMDVLDGRSGAQVAALLREVGFAVSEGAIEQGRDAVMAQVQRDLIEAVNRGVDGFEIRSERAEPDVSVAGQRLDGFRGDPAAMAAVQKVLAAPAVQVDLLGDVIPAERQSLQFVAGQAMERGVQGFAFDGLAGKYEVGFGLQEVVDLHATAAAAMALETVGRAVNVWRTKGHVGELPDLVSGSVQRILQGAPSVDGAKLLVRSFNDGSIAEYAREVGGVMIERVLAANGLDVNAPTVFKQAEAMDLAIASPNTGRGRYAGSVVGLDHCAALVKFSRNQALVISFGDLGEGQERPRLGDMVRVDYNKGVLSFTGAERGVGPGVGR